MQGEGKQTLISSGASSVPSLALTGATSSIVIDGRLDTTLTSGMCCKQKKGQYKCGLHKHNHVIIITDLPT